MPSHNYRNSRTIGQHAKILRKQSPRTEHILWKALGELRKQTGLHFRRQHPLPPYFADFACIKAKLVVELDGMSHDARQNHDAQRDAELRNRGWRVLRITNEEIGK